MCNDCLSSPLTSEESQNDYVRTFDLNGDPRYQKCFLCPACCFIPSEHAQKSGGACYQYFGAVWLRTQLKKCSWYPRPIHGTTRHTNERKRALILTIPLTIKYEVGHLWGGIVHFTLVTVFLSRAIFGSGAYLVDYLTWGGQCILIYILHVWPCMVQRLNRAQLYAAIAEFNIGSSDHPPQPPDNVEGGD